MTSRGLFQHHLFCDSVIWFNEELSLVFPQGYPWFQALTLEVLLISVLYDTAPKGLAHPSTVGMQVSAWQNHLLYRQDVLALAWVFSSKSIVSWQKEALPYEWGYSFNESLNSLIYNFICWNYAWQMYLCKYMLCLFTWSCKSNYWLIGIRYSSIEPSAILEWFYAEVL